MKKPLAFTQKKVYKIYTKYKMYTLLKVLLVVLLIVIAAEGGYYFHSLTSGTDTRLSQNQQELNPTVPSPAISPIIRGSFNSEYLNNLLNNNNIASSVLTNTFEGKIINVYPTPGVIKRPGIAYQKALEIQSNPNTPSFWAYYTENDLSILEVKKQEGEVEQPIQFGDLNPEDNIAIKETYDLLNRRSLEIKIIQK